MTYNQSILNKYRHELLHESYAGEENTLQFREHGSIQLESPLEQHRQQVMHQKSLNAEERQKVKNWKDNNNDNQTSNALLLIRRFKSKTCPYCNGQRNATVKHINPYTKPSTPQAFYNDILINKYRHVQSPHAWRNLSLNMNVGCKADEERNSVTLSLQNSLFQREEREQQMQKESERKEECKLQLVQKEVNPDIGTAASTTTSADHAEHERHKPCKDSNSETDNVKQAVSESNNTYFSSSKLFVVGPMVDQSELPFRMLCREYGATIAFTPMLHAKNFIESAQYRHRFYSTTSKQEVLEALHQQTEKKEEQYEVSRQEQEQLCQEESVESCSLLHKHEEEEEQENSELLESSAEVNKDMENRHHKLIDRPLVVQICGNDADTILAAARLVLYSNDYDINQNDKCDDKKAGRHKCDKEMENERTMNKCDSCITTKQNKDEENKYENVVNNTKLNSRNVNNVSELFPLYSCDAIDINLGCPQGIAKRGHYGSFLMEDWERVHTIIHTLHVELEVPVTAKIRVFDKPRTAKQINRNSENNDKNANNTNNVVIHNDSAMVATCNTNSNLDRKVNQLHKLTESATDIDMSEKCVSYVEPLRKQDPIGHDESNQDHKQEMKSNDDNHNMHKVQSSNQSMELREMGTTKTHDKSNSKVEEDYYLVHCTKQDSYSNHNSNGNYSSDDSLEYDAALTIAYAMMIRDAGAQMLTIHGRTRAMKGQNTQLANLSLIREIHTALNGSIPVIANGNVLNFNDVLRNAKITQCEGVMCAEPLLWDPSLFAHPTHPILCGRSFAADKITRLRAIQLALRYLSWCACYPVELGMIKAHLYKLCYHSYELHHTLRNALAHVCEDANLLSTSSTPLQETVSTQTRVEMTKKHKSYQNTLQENVCKYEKVANGQRCVYIQQLNALHHHLHELYKIEEISTITGPQPKLLRLAKEANRAELHANNFFDDGNNDNDMDDAKLNENRTNDSNLNDDSKNLSDSADNDVTVHKEDNKNNSLDIVF